MVLVDNAAYSYSFQIENGIPILPFYEGKDFELTALEEYLLKIENVHDVREFNRSIFQLEKYAEFESA
jgi:TFIIF-interacting CTD phosphatase-like protein